VGGRVEQAVVVDGAGEPVESSSSTDEDGHDTHVGAITAGDGDGSKQLAGGTNDYAGVAARCGIVSLDISEQFTTSTAICSFEWVHNDREQYGIEVVQNSWGRADTGGQWDPDGPAIRASNSLVVDDFVVVFSAAKQGPDASSLALEAMNPNVVTVAAVNDDVKTAQFCSRGPVELANGSTACWVKPDVAATSGPSGRPSRAASAHP
jgi:hypothetical protein